MLWVLIVTCITLWLFAMLASIGGSAAHLLLIAAVLMTVLQFISQRRAA